MDDKRYKLFVRELDADRNECINSTCYDTMSDDFDFELFMLQMRYGELASDWEAVKRMENEHA